MRVTAGAVPSSSETADRLAISDVLALHSRGVDRAHEGMLKACYWPEASVAYGSFNGSAHEFASILPQAIRRYARTQHSVTNTSSIFSGDSAAVESCVTAYHYLAVDDGVDQEMTYIGRYLDRFERRDAVWKIRHRQVVMDWNQNAPATAILDGPPFEGLVHGARFESDPLSALFESLGGVDFE